MAIYKTCDDCGKDFSASPSSMRRFCNNCEPQSVFNLVISTEIVAGVQLVENRRLIVTPPLSLKAVRERARAESWSIPFSQSADPELKTSIEIERIPARDILNSLGI